MNIHFTDKTLLNDLNNLTLARIKVGSHMYGLNNDTSDDDYLSIYAEPIKNRYSYMWEHHQLQYKDVNTDYNFTSLQGFIRNALSGDATINFEVLFSDELRDSELNWLWEYRESFINYNIIKSYLGLAKRDANLWSTSVNNMKHLDSNGWKKLSHFIRGVVYAEALLNGTFSIDFMNDLSHLEEYTNIEMLRKVKEGKINDVKMFNLFSHYLMKLTALRRELNDRLDDRKIAKFMDIKTLKEIDEKMMTYLNTIKYSVDLIDYKNLYYDALENGLNYK